MTLMIPAGLHYHINSDARFWDGYPVTSDDVKATYDALLNKGPMYIRSYLGDIKEIQVVLISNE